MLENECNYLLRRRHLNPTTSPPQCGDHWATRFLKAHPEYTVRLEVPRELDRQAAENPDEIQAWFEELNRTVGQYDIQITDTYNYDETGVRLGQGKKEYVITKSIQATCTAGKLTSRESSTVGETISADGHFLPPIVILTGKTIQQRWATQVDLPSNYLLAVSDTAYINDELAFEWIKHFEHYTAKRQIGKFRLLLLDGHNTHCTWEVINFCDNHHIILFALRPHTTHLCQPLDVACFQPYKHWYGKAVSTAYSTGCTDFDKMEFLNALHTVRLQTFKPHTIISAWAKSGIIPFNPSIVLNQLESPVRLDRQPSFDFGTPPPTTPIPMVTPQSAQALTNLANILYDPELADHPDINNWHDMFIRGSLAIANAGAHQYRQLQATHAAEKRRQQQRQDARKALQTGGVLYVHQARAMVKNSELQRLEEARLKLERMERIAANKAKREQLAHEVAARKQQRLYNKAHGITIPRKKKDAV
jgi:hypothetical protein